MKKVWKKMLVCMLMAIMIFTVGCAGEDEDNVEADPLQEINQIPEDGIITKEQFQTVAAKEKKVRFSGDTGYGTTYIWEFDAEMIQNPEDQNLKLTFNREVLDTVKKQYNDAVNALEFKVNIKSLIAVPVLSVTIPEVWEANSALLVLENDGVYTEMGNVEVAKDENAGTTTLTMKLTSVAGDCYIIGKTAAPEDISVQTKGEGEDAATTTADAIVTTDASTETTTAKKPETTTAKKPETTTAKKQETTTAKKPETTTAKKQETTTAKKPETTTAKKEETTTAAPKLQCTISINCKTILDNMDNLKAGKESQVPSSGVILKTTTVTFEDGESVLDVLIRICKSKGIHMEYDGSTQYGSAYIRGIHNLYEFDCGPESGWMYKVNGWFPNYGCSNYKLKDGDSVVWAYTCNGLGADLGAPMY